MQNRLLVRVAFQRAELWNDDKLLKTYTVSTARNGLGCVPLSYCTPYGKLRVARKLGDGLPFGTVFRDITPSDEIWSADPDNPLFAVEEDLALTRILWLEGAEPINMTTYDRQIFVHGTNREGLLGTPDSGGSIRFSNQDIIELYELLNVGDEVEVG
jgi:hypothetical protein